MSSLTVDTIEKFVGREVKDPYGRVVGKMISVHTDEEGFGIVKYVEIATNDFEIAKVEAKRLKVTPDALLVIPEWKVAAIEVESRLERVRKRLNAVDNLFRQGKIPANIYEEMKKSLNNAFEKIKVEVKNVKEMLRRRYRELEVRNMRLDRDMANLQMMFMSGEIDEEPFKKAFEYMESLKNWNKEEMEDINSHRAQIDRLEREASAVKPSSRTISVAKEAPKPEQPLKVQIIDPAALETA